MLISHRKQFIYTKTAKTAGTSVEVYFEPWCMPDGAWAFSHQRDAQVSEAGIVGHRGVIPEGATIDWYHHMPAAQIRERIGDAVWDSYFKFCVIRNPFDKAVSAFHFMARDLAAEAAQSSPRKLKKVFAKWIGNGKQLPVDRAQYVFDGAVCVDKIIRHENLADGVREVCERLKIPFEPERIPSLKVSGKRPRALSLADYYNAASLRAVGDVYGFEIEHFGYEPPEV